MLKKTALAAAIAATCASSLHAYAADSRELTEIREQIRQMKNDYESRIQALEKRLAEAQSQQKVPVTPTAAAPQLVEVPAMAAAPVPAAAASNGNGFNPAISLILGGTYAHIKQDPTQYRLQGFMTGGEVGPGSRSFNLGESELTFSANIDHMFSGQLTFALGSDNSASVEEAFIQAKGLAGGTNLKAGRFLSGIGYMNSQHAHTWDFVDAPLAYQAFLGGQYKQDGLQAKWIAPTDTYLEIGAEIGNGGSFPGTSRNKNGANAAAVFARTGGDIGASSSWRAGISYLRTRAEDRVHTELDGSEFAFSGRSSLWVADAVYKWAPGGNASSTSLKLQGEYFRQKENGTLDGGNYSSGAQSGWYIQGVYQFMPNWRTGLRHDRLHSGTPTIESGSFPSLAPYSPQRTSWMLDYSPSEFSRIRLQLAQDKSRPGVTDNQLFLQYIMSLGAHGAHSY